MVDLERSRLEGVQEGRNCCPDGAVIDDLEDGERKVLFPGEIQFAEPHEEDGARIWELIRDTGVLDLNSAYCYLMLCKYFPDSCVVARCGGKIVGYVSAFRPPQRPEVIFVWQVAVAEKQRGKGLGTAMLKEILKRKVCAGVRFLETTVTPSNAASRALFSGLARALDARYEVSRCFPAELFPEGKHEEELLFRIGPFGKRG